MVARDNAIGTTTVLSMAKNLAKYQPNVRLYLFYLQEKKKGLLR
jgi:ferredoxin-NADP reductase